MIAIICALALRASQQASPATPAKHAPQSTRSFPVEDGGEGIFVDQSGTRIVVVGGEWDGGFVNKYSPQGKLISRTSTPERYSVLGISASGAVVLEHRGTISTWNLSMAVRSLHSEGWIDAWMSGEWLCQVVDEKLTVRRDPFSKKPTWSIENASRFDAVAVRSDNRSISVIRFKGSESGDTTQYSLRGEAQGPITIKTSRGTAVQFDILACSAAYINATSLALFAETDGFSPQEREGLAVIELPDPHPSLPISQLAEQFVVRVDLSTGLARPVALIKWTYHGGDSVTPYHNKLAYSPKTSELYVLEGWRVYAVPMK